MSLEPKKITVLLGTVDTYKGIQGLIDGLEKLKPLIPPDATGIWMYRSSVFHEHSITVQRPETLEEVHMRLHKEEAHRAHQLALTKTRYLELQQELIAAGIPLS